MHWKQESPHNALRKQLCSITDHLKCLKNYEPLKLKKRTNLCGGYWNQIMIQIVIAKESCDLFGSWKTLSATYRVSKFSKGACPRTPPRRARPTHPCQLFAWVSNPVALLFKTLMKPLQLLVYLYSCMPLFQGPAACGNCFLKGPYPMRK